MNTAGHSVEAYPDRDASLGRKRSVVCHPASRQGCIPIGMPRAVRGIPFYRAIFTNGNDEKKICGHPLYLRHLRAKYKI